MSLELKFIIGLVIGILLAIGQAILVSNISEENPSKKMQLLSFFIQLSPFIALIFFIIGDALGIIDDLNYYVSGLMTATIISLILLYIFIYFSSKQQ